MSTSTAGMLAARLRAERAKVFRAYGAVALVTADLLVNGDHAPTDRDVTLGALEGARAALLSASETLSDIASELVREGG